jgi:hypothetical protein
MRRTSWPRGHAEIHGFKTGIEADMKRARKLIKSINKLIMIARAEGPSPIAPVTQPIAEERIAGPQASPCSLRAISAFLAKIRARQK